MPSENTRTLSATRTPPCPTVLRTMSLLSIADTFQEFQTSRQELDPDEIREQNEEFIELTECLRGRGWQIGDLAPDENGLLNPGGEFSSPDGTIDTDEIRTCVSEVSLAREQEGGG